MGILYRTWRRARALNASNPDLLYALLALAFMTFGMVQSGLSQEGDKIGLALVVLQTAPIAFARLAPLAAVGCICGGLVANDLLGYDVVAASKFSSLTGVFILGSTRSAGQSAMGGIIIIATIMIVFGSRPFVRGNLLDAVVSAGLFGGFLVTGALIRIRRERVRQVEQYAIRLEEERDYFAAEAISKERARIARELHDALGHTLNLIVIQAGAARRSFSKTPEAAMGASIDALQSIEQTGRDALADVDLILGMLTEPDQGADSKASRSPRPSLEHLTAMLDEARDAGLPVDFKTSGEPRPLPPSIDMSAYRVIQEAITNVLKHAAGAVTEVKIHYGPGELDLSVSNGPSPDTTGPASTGGGHRGLVGMRERALLFGGTFDAKPTADGGFKVSATFPISPGG